MSILAHHVCFIFDTPVPKNGDDLYTAGNTMPILAPPEKD